MYTQPRWNGGAAIGAAVRSGETVSGASEKNLMSSE
jgi:methionyl-tRNA formyltransferase